MALCTYHRKVISFSCGFQQRWWSQSWALNAGCGVFPGPRAVVWNVWGFLPCARSQVDSALSDSMSSRWPTSSSRWPLSCWHHDGWLFHTDFCTFTQKLRSRGEHTESVRQSEGGAVWPKGRGLGLNMDSPLNTNAVSVFCLSFLTYQGRIRNVFTSWTCSEEKNEIIKWKELSHWNI